ncbi:hypothetical protein HNR39_004144 [Glaciimonas immobilis]|uniref:Uncharacterized protein n=1 Tax=Glaciimonas immobilis TaxID=728004 RepID=A0A840S0X2_9BURK|nr:hypothetical protein [Glaciimonas immobilis]
MNHHNIILLQPAELEAVAGGASSPDSALKNHSCYSH